MPPILPTDVLFEVQKGQRWLRVPRPSQLPRELRLRDPEARSAYVIAAIPTEHRDFLQACLRCGTWTGSWCEGCYLRATKQLHRILEYSPLCTECDQAHLCCDFCDSDGITWESGHAAAGIVAEGEIQVTGFHVHGNFVEPGADIRIFSNKNGSVSGRHDVEQTITPSPGSDEDRHPDMPGH